MHLARKYKPKDRVTLSLSEKIDVIKDYKTGAVKCQRKLAEKYNVSIRTVNEILQNKALLRNAYTINTNTKRKRFNISTRYADINGLVWSWYRRALDEGIQMSGPMIQESVATC